MKFLAKIILSVALVAPLNVFIDLKMDLKGQTDVSLVRAPPP